MTERFSDRQGYRPSAVPITVREDAPPSLREAIPMLAKKAGMRPSVMREVICHVLLKQPDPSNWGDSYIRDEVFSLIGEAQWYKVYEPVPE